MGFADAFSLAGKNALVVGASSGIGRGIAVAFARAGANVAVVARREEKLREVVGEIEETGVKAFCTTADMANADDAVRCVAEAQEGLGPIDTMLYAAGTTVRTPTEALSVEDYDRVVNVNTRGAFVVAREVGRSLIERGASGSLLFIASLTTRAARPTITSYTVSKGAIRSLVQSLAVEWGAKGIRANAIAPGYIKTEMTEPLYTNEEFSRWVLGKTPADRWGEVDDVAPVAVFLASDAASFVQGQVIYVDGGWTANL